MIVKSILGYIQLQFLKFKKREMIMKKEILYLVTKNRDKNHSIQLWSEDKQNIKFLKTLRHTIEFYNTTQGIVSIEERNNDLYTKTICEFIPLNLFLQGNDSNWIMLETWSDKDDLMIKFGEFCAKELGLRFDII